MYNLAVLAFDVVPNYTHLSSTDVIGHGIISIHVHIEPACLTSLHWMDWAAWNSAVKQIRTTEYRPIKAMHACMQLVSPSPSQNLVALLCTSKRGHFQLMKSNWFYISRCSARIPMQEQKQESVVKEWLYLSSVQIIPYNCWLCVCIITRA